ncbi:helix-turn-helix domain-containing protein, partial [Sphaerisporangium sp. NPDC088356]|uniref:helix-turn-helix domain-containing protein n=1 Tax=Sphaerisporangium sp. NPDC088356 TaxID=3154871 RepID=UPI003431B31B
MAQVRDREATTSRILAAARHLFAEHGYDQVTVRMIAAAAGANVALINRYFGSKARLFAEVLAGESAMESLIEGDPEKLPRRLAAHMAHRLSAGASDPIADSTLARSTALISGLVP